MRRDSDASEGPVHDQGRRASPCRRCIWRLTDDSCWPWGDVAKAVTSTLLAQLCKTGVSPGWQRIQDRKRPKGVARAAVRLERTWLVESSLL